MVIAEKEVILAATRLAGARSPKGGFTYVFKYLQLINLRYKVETALLERNVP